MAVDAGAFRGGFRDRRSAGRLLARRLLADGYGDLDDVVVLALPRGGVPVGFEIACALDAPLDIFVVRKLGVPGQEELALGAVTTGGVRVLNDVVVAMLDLTSAEIDALSERELREVERRERDYRDGRAALELRRKTVILVDDGLATGASMRAAIRAVRKRDPARIVVAVPVGAAETCRELAGEADDVVCAVIPWPFLSVGSWYAHFEQTSDEEVRSLLTAPCP